MFQNPIRAFLLFTAASVSALAAPANDLFSSRVTISGNLPATVSGTNVDGTLETNEVNHGGASVWYSWTAPATGQYDISLLNTNFDATYRVFTGTSPGSLDLVHSGSTFTPLPATGGTIYQIAVCGLHGSEGKFDLRIRNFSLPANDAFANRISIPSSVPTLVAGSNVDATRETGETYPENTDQASVWYSWTAPSTGRVEVSLLNPTFSSIFYIYSGNPFKSPSMVRVGRVQEALSAIAGTTYHIAVMGYRGGQGDFQLSIRNLQPPVNDSFANSMAIPSGFPGSQKGWNAGASLEPGEQQPGGWGNPDVASVWYHWTSPGSGQVEFSLPESDFSGYLRIFTGDSLEMLQLIPSSTNKVTFATTAGTTYRVAVVGNTSDANYSEGEFRIGIRDVTPAAHDNFVNSIQLTGPLPLVTTGANFGATLEPGEPDQWYDGASVWYRWTAPAAGRYEIKITQEDFDSELFVFTGSSLNTLARIQTQNAWTTVTANAGTTYRIAVHGNYGLQGNFQLTIRSVTPPTNDNFGSSTQLSPTLPTSRTGTTTDATLEGEEPYDHSSYGPSVWYHWTATSTGNVEISLPLSTHGSAFHIYRGNSLGSLTHVMTGTSREILSAVSGTVYRIAVTKRSSSNQAGTFQFRIGNAVPPANDLFANRTTVPAGFPSYIHDSNFAATAEAGEPDTTTPDRTSVWYSWTAPATGDFEIRNLYSDFTPRILVFSGTALNALNRLAIANDRVTFAATAGSTYQIMVNGTENLQGKFRLMISHLVPPANDHFANRTPIPGTLPQVVNVKHANSTLEAGEPDPSSYGGSSSVWYSWTAPVTGKFRFGTLGDISPGLRVFTGDSLATLSHVVSGYHNVSVTATAGTVYQIAVRSAPPEYQMTVSDITPPVNDSFADRIEISSLPASLAGSNANATTESYEKSPSYNHGASIWYRWTAPAAGRVRITTIGSGFDTILQVTTGATLQEHQVVVMNDDAGAGVETSKVVIDAQQGVEYQIAIYGYKMAKGFTQLNISTDAPGIGDWASGHGLTGAEASPDATPRADGIPNLLKYAFNMPPGAAASGSSRHLSPEGGTSGLPFISETGGVLTIEYIRSLTAPDLVYRPQFSSSLAPDGPDGWLDATGDEEIVPLDSSWERVIIRDAASGPARFGRVVVELGTAAP